MSQILFSINHNLVNAPGMEKMQIYLDDLCVIQGYILDGVLHGTVPKADDSI